jgi:hypothetical protein
MLESLESLDSLAHDGGAGHQDLSLLSLCWYKSTNTDAKDIQAQISRATKRRACRAVRVRGWEFAFVSWRPGFKCL